ncbi:MAG: OmpH family outer membrane protein [Gammaproteobacteria bacterium]
MKKFMLAVFVLGGFAFSPAQSAEGIAYINFERVYQESKIVRRVRDSVNAKFKEREDGLREQDEAIRNIREEAQKESLTLSDADLEKKAAEIEQLERNFVRERRALAEDRGAAMQERRRSIDEQIVQVAARVAREENYSMVLNPFLTVPVSDNRALVHNIIVFADKTADITDAVIAGFDESADFESLAQ